jgi:hypothetical protein
MVNQEILGPPLPPSIPLAPGPEPRGLLVDLGNPRCPVMNGTPDGKSFSDWRGLRIGHCCGACVPKFAADPEWYLEAAGIEWRGPAGMVRQVERARGAGRAEAVARLRSRWPVVREPDAD